MTSGRTSTACCRRTRCCRRGARGASGRAHAGRRPRGVRGAPPPARARHAPRGGRHRRSHRRGARDALYSLCKGASRFPSLYEGFGLPLLEAMACGAPVLAGDNSSLSRGRRPRRRARRRVAPAEHRRQARRAPRRRRRDAATLSDHGLRRGATSSPGPRPANARPGPPSRTWRRSGTHSVSRIASRDRSAGPRIAPRDRRSRRARTGIADYVSELLPHLRTSTSRSTLYVEAPRMVDDPLLRATFRISCDARSSRSTCDRYTAIVLPVRELVRFTLHMVDLIEGVPRHRRDARFLSQRPGVRPRWLPRRGRAFAREIDRSHGLRRLVDYRRHGEQHAAPGPSTNASSRRRFR